jgi:hypothetical protein
MEGFGVQLIFKIDARMHAQLLQSSTPSAGFCNSNLVVHYNNLVCTQMSNHNPS